MSSNLTCDICGAMITKAEEREAEILPRPSGQVWIHTRCRGRKPGQRYVPEGDAREAYKALDDPTEVDADFWVSARAVESKRRRDDTDYEAGLDELIERDWAEAKDDRSAFRLTPTGRSLRGRVFPKD